MAPPAAPSRNGPALSFKPARVDCSRSARLNANVWRGCSGAEQAALAGYLTIVEIASQPSASLPDVQAGDVSPLCVQQAVCRIAPAFDEERRELPRAEAAPRAGTAAWIQASAIRSSRNVGSVSASSDNCATLPTRSRRLPMPSSSGAPPQVTVAPCPPNCRITDTRPPIVVKSTPARCRTTTAR